MASEIGRLHLRANRSVLDPTHEHRGTGEGVHGEPKGSCHCLRRNSSSVLAIGMQRSAVLLLEQLGHDIAQEAVIRGMAGVG